MARKRVLIPGAAGYRSRQLLPVVREHYDLVLLDWRKPHDIEDLIEVDLVNPDSTPIANTSREPMQSFTTRAALARSMARSWRRTRPPTSVVWRATSASAISSSST